MHLALWMVALAVTVVAVTAASRRVDLPAPIVLVVVGVVAGYLPLIPEFRLTEEIVLVGLLPPLLYNAALRTSVVDFNANRASILSLSIGLVVFTTLGVGVVVHAVLPGVGWPAAFALGAVVAPPDAVAATAVARRIGMPRRIVTVLEGESLLNDATALVALRTAILALTSTVGVLEVAGDFVVTATGGVLAGLLVALVVARVRRWLVDPVLDTSVSLVVPFLAWGLAEGVHASGVLAVVVAGLVLGHRAPVLQTASSRIAERLNWQTISFLLEHVVFLLIGLQAHWLLEGVRGSGVASGRVLALCVSTMAAVVLLRVVWVFALRRWLTRPRHRGGRRPPWQYTAVVSWAGMRGVVTLAAAFAIPPDTRYREVLLLAAFFVVAGTLVLHGFSLPWLVRRLGVPAPDPREDALARAELLQQAGQAGLARLEELEGLADHDDDAIGESLRGRLEQREFAAWERLGADVPVGETPSERYARLRLGMLAAERARVLELRDGGRVPHEVVEDVLLALDVEESMIDRGAERRGRLAGSEQTGAGMSRAVEECEHLEEAGDLPEPGQRACEDCLREGSTWVHLRQCLSCGRVGCCDSSPARHASAHHRATGHPVVRSAEPGEVWRWCFVDERLG